jgi:hypothetical protein
MPEVDCTARRYHCTRLPDVDLCPLAYAEGRFPPGTSAKDFVLIEATPAEVLRLSSPVCLALRGAGPRVCPSGLCVCL